MVGVGWRRVALRLVFCAVRSVVCHARDVYCVLIQPRKCMHGANQLACGSNILYNVLLFCIPLESINFRLGNGKESHMLCL